MKKLYRSFAFASFAFAAVAGFAACADDSPKLEAVSVEASPETKVVRYSAADIAALKPGELLRLDLTHPGTVYALTYTDVAALDRVLVMRREDQYVLRDKAPATAANDDELKQIVVSADKVMDPGGGKSLDPQAVAAPPEQDIIKMCKCPCCIENDHNLYCCE